MLEDAFTFLLGLLLLTIILYQVYGRVKNVSIFLKKIYLKIKRKFSKNLFDPSHPTFDEKDCRSKIDQLFNEEDRAFFKTASFSNLVKRWESLTPPASTALIKNITNETTSLTSDSIVNDYKSNPNNKETYTNNEIAIVFYKYIDLIQDARGTALAGDTSEEQIKNAMSLVAEARVLFEHIELSTLPVEILDRVLATRLMLKAYGSDDEDLQETLINFAGDKLTQLPQFIEMIIRLSAPLWGGSEQACLDFTNKLIDQAKPGEMVAHNLFDAHLFIWSYKYVNEQLEPHEYNPNSRYKFNHSLNAYFKRPNIQEDLKRAMALIYPNKKVHSSTTHANINDTMCNWLVAGGFFQDALYVLQKSNKTPTIFWNHRKHEDRVKTQTWFIDVITKYEEKLEFFK